LFDLDLCKEHRLFAAWCNFPGTGLSLSSEGNGDEVTEGVLGVEDDRSGLCLLYVQARLILGMWKDDPEDGVAVEEVDG
jgi:hypothetical protein